MRSEALPAEAEVVTGAVLRVYKFPAYGTMAATGAGHVHQSQLVLRVFTPGDDVTTQRSETTYQKNGFRFQGGLVTLESHRISTEYKFLYAPDIV